MNKTTGVLEHIKETDTDVCFLQETFLKKKDAAKLAEIREYGYGVISVPRPRCGGGIAAIYRHDLHLQHNKKIERFKTFEIMEMTLKCDQKLFRFVNMYRAPYSKKHRFTESDFIDEFENYLQILKHKNGTPILIGDFNIHVEKSDDTYAKQFRNLLVEHKLIQMVPHIPTHNCGGTLDLVITEKDTDITISEPTVIKLGTTSDHFYVKAVISDLKLDFSSADNKFKNISFRKFNDIDIEMFRDDLVASGIMDTSNFTSLDHAVDFMDSTLTLLMDKHCPVINRKVKVKHLEAKWFDSDLRNLRTKRRAAERLKRKHDTKENRTKYINIRNHFNKLVWAKKRLFYQKSIKSSMGDKQALFKKIKKLMGLDDVTLPKCSDDLALAEKFKTFFSEKISDVRSEIESQRSHASNNAVHWDAVSDHDTNLNSFKPLCMEDVTDIVDSMNNKFCSLDPIPTWLFKKCNDELSPIVTYIINESLNTGIFPQKMKHAVVKPILKSADMDCDLCKSYRPVSNLSFLSKILEKVVLRQMMAFLENNGLICDVQSGYRPHHSCETLLVRMFNDINGLSDENKIVSLLLLDLSAAFDVLDHDILLRKLQYDYGIGSNVLRWIESYLKNRSFAVKINNTTSKLCDILYGVPQGSLLGPILFILYTKELKRIARHFGLDIQLYVDDSQLYIAFDVLDPVDKSEKLNLIQECLKAIKQWMINHFMKLNDGKTEFILVGKNMYLSQCNEITLDFDGITIKQSDFKNDTGKSLGVKLDSNLSMERQVKEVRKKVYWTLSNLKTFGHYLSEDTRLQLVKTLILSKIDYCNALYAGVNKTVLKKLQNAVDDAVRFIYGIQDYGVDLVPSYKKAHILPVDMRIKYKVCLLTHKTLQGSAPPYLHDLIRFYHLETNKQSLRAFSDKRLLLRSDLNDSKITRRMFSFHAPTLWNDLTYQLRHCDDTDTFKKDLKTFYFKKF